MQPCQLADGIDICFCVVLVAGSPCSDNLRYSISLVLTYVATEDTEACPYSVLHADEYFEFTFHWACGLAKPRVTNSDVEGVIVPYPSGCCCF